MDISVIIPVYNAERFLEKAVNSALQFSEVKEVLLIEDQSPDNSLEVCKKLIKQDSRVKLLQHPDKGNHGAGASRNLGLENASQEFIAFLDSDDYYLSNRFDAEKEIFKDKKIEGVFGALGTEFLTEKGAKEFKEKFKETSLTTVKYDAEGHDVFIELMSPINTFGTFFHLNTLTIRKSALVRENLKFNPELKVHQDQDFITKLSYHVHLKTGNISSAIAIRGVHDDNRITKIKLYSDAYNKRQNLLWNSVWEWAKHKEMSSEIKSHIRLQQKAFEVSQKMGISKVLTLLFSILKNPAILKTKYRFTYLRK